MASSSDSLRLGFKKHWPVPEFSWTVRTKPWRKRAGRFVGYLRFVAGYLERAAFYFWRFCFQLFLFVADVHDILLSQEEQ